MMRVKRRRFALLRERLKAIGIVRSIAVLLLAIGGAYVGFIVAMAGVTRSKNPAMTLQFLPKEGEALAKQAELFFVANPEKPPSEVARLARQSLHSQALNPRALRLLGYVHSQEDKTDSKAEELIDLAVRLSRREPGAQLWLVQRAALQNDLPSAIKHIDILLRAHPNSEAVVFPVLIRGVADPRFRRLFQGYMRNSTPWVDSFLAFAVANTTDLPSLVAMIDEAGGFPDGEGSAAQSRRLMGRLSEAEQFDALERIYMLMPGATASRLRSTELDAGDVGEQFGIAGWQSFDGADAGAAVVRQRGQSRPQMMLYANSSITRSVASKLLYLRPGTYQLSTNVADIQADQGGGLSWQLRCPTSPQNYRPSTGRLDAKQTTVMLTVPPSCPIQFLDLVASGGQGQSGLDATITSIRLTTAGHRAAQ